MSPATAGASDTPGPLLVVATTSLIGDVARHVAEGAAADGAQAESASNASTRGKNITVTTLLPAGVDPHAWTPTPQDLVMLSNADLLLINGLGLEEGLIPLLATIDGPVVVTVNDNVPTLAGAEDAHAAEGESAHGVDPHTWQDVANVRIWTQNISAAFAGLDPDHADTYAANALAYDAALATLDDELRQTLAIIPAAARRLVTDHDDMAYFAHAYDFTVVGTIIPSVSAMASISAQAMAGLQQQIEAESVKAIFVGTTVNATLADQIARDTGATVIPLYTDALSAAGGPASTYLAMMRHNANAIANALQ